MKKIALSGWVLLILLTGCGRESNSEQLRLNASITATNQHLMIQNGDPVVWKNVTVTIDDHFTYHAEYMPRGGESIPLDKFVDENGDAFEPGLLKFRKVIIYVPNFVGGKDGIFKW